MNRITILLSLIVCGCAVVPAVAQNADEEKLSQDCEVIYAKLCAGMKPGPEMIGKCNRARPTVYEKVPAKCTTDFQNKVEGYEDFMRENGGK